METAAAAVGYGANSNNNNAANNSNVESTVYSCIDVCEFIRELLVCSTYLMCLSMFIHRNKPLGMDLDQ